MYGLIGGGGMDKALCGEAGSGASTLAQPSPAASDGGGGCGRVEEGGRLCNPPWTSEEEVEKARARAIHRINSFEFCAALALSSFPSQRLCVH